MKISKTGFMDSLKRYVGLPTWNSFITRKMGKSKKLVMDNILNNQFVTIFSQ